MPGASWPPVLAAFGTAAFFLLLTVKLVVPALFVGAFTMAMAICWMWTTDPGPSHPPVDIGGGIKLPVYVTGPLSHSWWAMVVLILVSVSTLACLIFSYFFLWTVSPEVWPVGADGLPAADYPLAAALLLILSSSAMAYASRALGKTRSRFGPWPMRLFLLLAIPFLLAAFGVELYAHWQSGLRPTDSGYAATVYAFIATQGFFVAVVTVMGLYTFARSLCGLLNGRRRATFDNTMLFWHYTVVQGLAMLAVVHTFPRLLG
jgi:cytochrome c oxidase subunit I+III